MHFAHTPEGIPLKFSDAIVLLLTAFGEPSIRSSHNAATVIILKPGAEGLN